MTAERNDYWTDTALPSGDDLILIGAALLNWLSATTLLGHASPGSTLDYVHSESLREGDPATEIVRDFIAWTSGRKGFSPECRERLTNYITTTGWMASAMQVAESRLLPSRDAAS